MPPRSAWATAVRVGAESTPRSCRPGLSWPKTCLRPHCVRPDIPWAAGATLVYLILYIAWFNGAGPPARWKAGRRYRLRLWRAGSNGWSRQGIGLTLALMATNGFFAFVWIMLGAPKQPPDLSAYPTTAYLISMLVMGPLVSGVTEEAAFRGYMQRGLERFGAGTAVT